MLSCSVQVTEPTWGQEPGLTKSPRTAGQVPGGEAGAGSSLEGSCAGCGSVKYPQRSPGKNCGQGTELQSRSQEVQETTCVVSACGGPVLTCWSLGYFSSPLSPSPAIADIQNTAETPGKQHCSATDLLALLVQCRICWYSTEFLQNLREISRVRSFLNSDAKHLLGHEGQGSTIQTSGEFLMHN